MEVRSLILQYFIKTLFYSSTSLFVTILALKLWFEPKAGKCKCNVKLKGKVALVTGGNSGIGFETARNLAKRGAHVVIASRNEKKSKEAVQEIIATTGNQNVCYRILDLANFLSIRKFAKDFNEDFDRLDILVNNAGCAGIKPILTEDGIEEVTQVNYVGPFLLTNLLINKLEASKPSRIVVVASVASDFHDFDRDDIAAVKRTSGSSIALTRIYCNSKLCDIFWTKALAKRLPHGVTINALHPGVVKTGLFQRLSPPVRASVLFAIGIFFKKPQEGAQNSIGETGYKSNTLYFYHDFWMGVTVAVQLM